MTRQSVEEQQPKENIFSRFVLGPAMMVILLVLLIVTVLDYRAKIVFDNNQQIIAENLAAFIQESRLNNRKIFEQLQLDFEKAEVAQARIDAALSELRDLMKALKERAGDLSEIERRLHVEETVQLKPAGKPEASPHH